MKNKLFGLVDELLINPELNSRDIHSCVSHRIERIEIITEMIRGTEEYAYFKDYKLLTESANFTIDRLVGEIKCL